MLLSRKNQLLLEFSFWNEPIPRPGPNIYELRSYQLRVSPMVRSGPDIHELRPYHLWVSPTAWTRHP